MSVKDYCVPGALGNLSSSNLMSRVQLQSPLYKDKSNLKEVLKSDPGKQTLELPFCICPCN
jgi:hypothetical protein